MDEFVNVIMFRAHSTPYLCTRYNHRRGDGETCTCRIFKSYRDSIIRIARRI